MQHINLQVPSNVNFISDWTNFDSILPQGKVILNKSICGCGCTEYYLNNEIPVILVSPRKELINCKMDKPGRIRQLFYFDRSVKEKVEKTIQRLEDYVSITDKGFIPKILVTYDSVKIVLDALFNKGYLKWFSIIVDEFPCIFTDAQFKGLTELNMIRCINHLDNHTVFISATPIGDIYLDEMPEFCNIPIVTLQWPQSKYETINLVRQKMENTQNACGQIINAYKTNGYFKSAIIDGEERYSTEAVFFLNNVTDITAIIDKFKLTPENTLVICSEDAKNRIKLKDLGFDIGHVANENVYKTENKTFTFVTKTSFEGTDFYSDCSSTYIFADPNKTSLSLDISIDLPQIAGRCRTKCNPFRREITYFYRTTMEETINDYFSEVQKRIQNTNERLSETNNILSMCSEKQRKSLLSKLKSAQEREKYKNDYLDVIDYCEQGCLVPKLVGNNYVKLADLRAIEIMKEQYQSNYSVFVYLDSSGFRTANPFSGNDAARLRAFCQNFSSDKNFIRRMKLYVDFLEAHPEDKQALEAVPQIDMNIKYYYNTLPPERIKALGYREQAIKDEIQEIQSFDDVKTALENVLTSSRKYTSGEMKSIIQQVYDQLNIDRTAKGTDIEKYLPSAKKTTVTDIDGKRKKGYSYE